MATATTAPGSWDARRVYRQSVLIGVWLVVALALAGFARFPQITGSLGVPLAEVLLALAFVAVASWVALRLLRLGAAGVSARHALAIAVPVSALWVAYLLVTHLALKDAQKPTIGATLTWIVFGATVALTLAVGALAARGTGRVATGAVAGLCGGVLAALIVQLCLLAMLDLAMPTLARHMNAGELSAYLSSGWPDRGAWYYWNEEFVGGIGYFLTLANVGAVAGAIGGLAGHPFARGVVAARAPK